jgi:hypothetical protein
MDMKKFLLLITGCALSACGPIESKVRNSLIRSGIAKDDSTCMAKPMSDKLSIAQLRRLATLGNFEGKSTKEIREMGYDRFMHNVRALKDPEIVLVVSTAWVKCALP